ncbi:MAG: large subunit ribosomal protein [Desulfovibrionales bacterium]|jgi:large subunit ribosomal protein L9|nr:large subunit ribosomal protein [Desulfovibrionales bacterium]
MATMKIILRDDVEPLGRLGDIVTVKAGYGRNYLIPTGLAQPATKGSLKQFELERRKLEAKVNAMKAGAQAIADKLAQITLLLNVNVGENDKMYGSVTTSNIADALSEQGVDIDRKKIVLDDSIRSLGEFDLEVKLHPDVRGQLKVVVAKHGQTLEDLAAEAAAEEAEQAAAAEDGAHDAVETDSVESTEE